jgi:hypothetical protein
MWGEQLWTGVRDLSCVDGTLPESGIQNGVRRIAPEDRERPPETARQLACLLSFGRRGERSIDEDRPACLQQPAGLAEGLGIRYSIT